MVLEEISKQHLDLHGKNGNLLVYSLVRNDDQKGIVEFISYGIAIKLFDYQNNLLECSQFNDVCTNKTEVIELIEKVLTKEELIGACKFNILKYRLRVGNKDEIGKELQKIKDYENYLKFLEGEDEIIRP